MQKFYYSTSLVFLIIGLQMSFSSAFASDCDNYSLVAPETSCDSPSDCQHLTVGQLGTCNVLGSPDWEFCDNQKWDHKCVYYNKAKRRNPQ